MATRIVRLRLSGESRKPESAISSYMAPWTPACAGVTLEGAGVVHIGRGGDSNPRKDSGETV